MDLSRVKTVVVDGTSYEAVRLTGFGPIDIDAMRWIETRTGRAGINIDGYTGPMSPGLVYSEKKGKLWLLCKSEVSELMDWKRLKPGKWIVSSQFGTVDLLKNDEFQEQFIEPDRKNRQEKIHRYVPIAESEPVRAVKMSKDSVQEVLSLFDDQHVDRYSVDLSDHHMNIWFTPEPYTEVEWQINFGMWIVRNEKTFTFMTEYAFNETYKLS